MFGKQKLLILPIAALGLTLSGAAFAQSTSQTAGKAVCGPTSPITQTKFTNHSTEHATMMTPAEKLAKQKLANEKLANAAIYGSTSPFVQDKYTSEG